MHDDEPIAFFITWTVTAIGYKGSRVRDQFKANCTRVLREQWQEFDVRPVWTTGGDWQCINNQEELEQVIAYVSEAQDLMHLDRYPLSIPDLIGIVNVNVAPRSELRSAQTRPS